MRARFLIAVVIIGLIAVFAAINWSVFVAPTTLSLGVSSFEAPLGLVMLALLGVVVLAFAAYMAVWQSSMLLETRRFAKELQAQRTLADQAEASRFTELRGFVQAEMERLHARLQQMQDELRHEIDASGNSLAAHIGEVDDRLQRRAIGGPGGPA